MDDLLNELEAAKYITMSAAFLRMARLRGVVGNRTPGPPYLKLGRNVRYRRADLDQWLEQRRIVPGEAAEHHNVVSLHRRLRS